MKDFTNWPHCKECEQCYYYWENMDDDYEDCGGDDKTCNDFIPKDD